MRFLLTSFFCFFLASAMFSPVVGESVFAQSPPGAPVVTPAASPAPVVATPPAAKPAPVVATPRGKVSLVNPLGDKTLAEFAKDIISVLLVFITPIIVLAYILAGFKYVISQGKPEEIKKATQWLLYISIGAVLALGAFTILQVIENTINAFRV